MTITWVVEQLDTYPLFEAIPNVVYNVHWRINASDGEYTATVYGTRAIPYNSKDTFTPFNKLTEAQIINWVKSEIGEVGIAEIEARLTYLIDNQRNPVVYAPPLPWDHM
jgi:hypothetical protein